MVPGDFSRLPRYIRADDGPSMYRSPTSPSGTGCRFHPAMRSRNLRRIFPSSHSVHRPSGSKEKYGASRSNRCRQSLRSRNGPRIAARNPLAGLPPLKSTTAGQRRPWAEADPMPAFRQSPSGFRIKRWASAGSSAGTRSRAWGVAHQDGGELTDGGKVKPLPNPHAKKSVAVETQMAWCVRRSTGCPYSLAVQQRLAWPCTVPLGWPVDPDE